jgi:hypothetical protein
MRKEVIKTRHWRRKRRRRRASERKITHRLGLEVHRFVGSETSPDPPS